MTDTLIIAPHPDDEIIGCYEILASRAAAGKETAVLYTDVESIPWLHNSQVTSQMELGIVPLLNLTTDGYGMATVYAPDPVYEFHPAHRRWGAHWEQMMRVIGVHVVFYNVNMQAPYIHEVAVPSEKRRALDLYYPEKHDLWKYDHKYFLFEGRCEWRMGV